MTITQLRRKLYLWYVIRGMTRDFITLGVPYETAKRIVTELVTKLVTEK